ncbi:hypothetical protein GIB67_016881 [Kingdonia uniflora]|uniref:Uncharacterized protein n=1 Tax=Kingdonia uniflora TaxID=39325 RepID=A0A7J7M386_9MAGN|nr:hypothetical protein GIB67_016881 [Kingdonia uniflora]
MLQVKGADNRIIQEQLNQKICECQALEETISVLKEQLSDTLEVKNSSHTIHPSQNFTNGRDLQEDICMNRECRFSEDANEESLLQTQVQFFNYFLLQISVPKELKACNGSKNAEADEIEELKHKVDELTEAKQQLETRNRKLAEESSYAKGLASAAAVELKALSEEVSKLMDLNERLTTDLAASKNSSKNLTTQRRPNGVATRNNGVRKDSNLVKRNDQGGSRPSPAEDIKRREREREISLSFEAALLEKERNEEELQKKVGESKQREEYLENELANMWILVANLKNGHEVNDHDIRETDSKNSI